MQAQTMAKVPPSQPSILPPLQNLPSWSRSSLERRKQPRPIVRDPQPLDEGTDQDFQMPEDHETNLYFGNDARIVSAPSRTGEKDLRQKVSEMEKSLDFVQDQHAQVLRNLHEEIERLKIENKDLNFKLVMSRSGVNIEEISPVPSEELADQNSPKSHVKPSKEKPLSANKQKQAKSNKSPENENTNKEIKSTIENKRNSRHSSANIKIRESSGKMKSAPTPPNSGKKPTNSLGSGKSNFLTKARTKQQQKDQQDKVDSNSPIPQSPLWSSVHGGQQMIMVTLTKDKTIQVHVPTENGPRSPTLAECKTIIVEQQETNHKQARELLKLRTDLREAIISQKWNQNSYLVGKSFSKANSGPSNLSGGKSNNSNRHLPQLPVKEPVNSGRIQPKAPTQQERVTLPSLRPNINTGVADRRRRQQAILRGRMGRRDFY